MKNCSYWLALCLIYAMPVWANSTASRLNEIRATGTLRICMSGDYPPYTLRNENQQFEGIDVDLGNALAIALGVTAHFVQTSWPTLNTDFLEKCDIAMGGISITQERQKIATFSAPHMRDGKTAIVRCQDVQKFNSLMAIDQTSTRAIVNPGGSNERFAQTNYKHAKLTIYPDNTTIFNQIVEGKADVMITDTNETRWQAKQHPELCPIHPESPLQPVEKAFMLPYGDIPFKTFVDSWMQKIKANGEYARIYDAWLQ